MEGNDTSKFFQKGEINSKKEKLGFYKESLKKNQFLKEISFYGKK
jgi:hypothetical protein